MGEYRQYQTLSGSDKVTVVIYRAGIVLSTVVISVGAWALLIERGNLALFNFLIPALHVSVGASVFFIHLYVSKFHRLLKMLYALALAALAVLYMGAGGPAGFVAANFWAPLLFLPLAGCLGFVTAKEAFCFRQYEGYVLAMGMPLYLLIVSIWHLTPRPAGLGLALIAALLVLFTLRKTFMPIHCDIGDKSAYQ